jgi:hypothetical protein
MKSPIGWAAAVDEAVEFIAQELAKDAERTRKKAEAEEKLDWLWKLRSP